MTSRHHHIVLDYLAERNRIACARPPVAEDHDAHVWTRSAALRNAVSFDSYRVIAAQMLAANNVAPQPYGD